MCANVCLGSQRPRRESVYTQPKSSHRYSRKDRSSVFVAEGTPPHPTTLNPSSVSPRSIPLKTTLCSYSSVQYAGYLQPLTRTAQSTVREIDPEDALTFLRLRTEQYEIIVSPGNWIFKSPFSYY
uniref:Roadblock/LAMTOR2 domain-containing protein n=1 Tax=Ornithorhynchus anatinus TaxID=9258 RepID=F7CC60_ORNAN